MSRALAKPRAARRLPVAAEAVLDALPDPVIAVDSVGAIGFVNPAGEQFLGAGANALRGRPLSEIVPPDSPLHALIDRARRLHRSFSEFAVPIETPRLGRHIVGIDVAPMPGPAGAVAVVLHERAMADKVDRQLTHRDSARSLAAMAAMLAHEVKNPLSGIRGAAQLLERDAAPAERELTRLICQETDRIARLVDGMELFADRRPIERRALNIHEVLAHVRRVAEAGFARGHRFAEVYDPSLPPVYGNRDRLVQVFINLVKNAAEAAPGGSIRLSTAYRPGVRLRVAGGGGQHLPIEASVEDNGPGVPPDLGEQLFDPFVSGKEGGRGLGLAVVAKFIAEHGGIVEYASRPRRTVFSVLLPMASRGEE